jgi:hypothetical protein
MHVIPPKEAESCFGDRRLTQQLADLQTHSLTKSYFPTSSLGRYPAVANTGLLKYSLSHGQPINLVLDVDLTVKLD